MIPRTFPSTFAANGQQQMVVYSLPSITGLTAWIDYIPVKGVTTESATLENTYANGGYQVVDSLASLTGKQAWLDYIPVYEDASYTKPWSTDAGGYIPTSALAALLLDFTSGRLDPRITFSRTTNATVTGSNGLIQYAPMNMLTFSEQFDNAAWQKSLATVTANAAVAPDNTTTADKVIATAVSGNHTLFVVTTPTAGISYSFSYYAKSAEYTKAGIRIGGAGYATTPLAAIDLANGAILSQQGFASLTVQNVGNGWYRIAGSFVSGTGLTPNIQPLSNSYSIVSDNFTYTGDGTSGIYISDAQLELGGTATTYNPTTVKNLLGFTENFDNAAWTKSNAFVQTNLLTYSQMFGGSWNSNAGDTVTGNAATAPDGTTTATLVALTSGVTNLRALSAIPITAGATLTASMYLKAGAGSQFQALILYGASGSYRAWLNTTTGAVSGGALSGTYSNGSMTAVDAGNGWWRVAVTATTATDTSLTWETDQANASGSYSAVAGSSFYCWGAQLVQGTTPGDYKATYAAAAAVGYTDIYGQPFAQKLVESTANNAHFVAVTTIGSVSALETLSFYAKAAERTWCAIQMGSSALAYYDIQNGTIGAQLNGTATITLVGNGWFKCSLTAVRVANGNNNLYTATGNNAVTYTGDGTSGIYIFGAQLSDSASVDPYVYQPVAAPTSTAYYGPRFDYDPVTLAPKGLLIEEQRTNLLAWSEQLDNAAWVKINTAITTNTVVAPDGTLTGDKLASSTAVIASHQCYQISVAITNGVSYTWSVYMKQGEYAWGIVNAFSATDSRTYFNLANGTVGTVAAGATATITPVGNGWYRCTVTRTSAAITGGLSIEMTNADNVPSFAAAVGSGIYIWGAQLEAGAFATSYIPTEASQVTRAADNASMIGNNFARWYNATEGTLFTQALPSEVPASDAIVRFAAAIYDNLTYANAVRLERLSGAFRDVQTVSGSSVVAAATWNIGVVGKVAGAYANSNSAAVFNAGTVSSLSGSVPTGITQLGIGGNGSSGNNWCGHISRIAYYPRRLANTELQGITS